MSDNNITKPTPAEDETALKVTPGAWIALIAVLLVFPACFLRSKGWTGSELLILQRLAVPSAP